MGLEGEGAARTAAGAAGNRGVDGRARIDGDEVRRRGRRRGDPAVSRAGRTRIGGSGVGRRLAASGKHQDRRRGRDERSTHDGLPPMMCLTVSLAPCARRRNGRDAT